MPEYTYLVMDGRAAWDRDAAAVLDVVDTPEAARAAAEAFGDAVVLRGPAAGPISLPDAVRMTELEARDA